MKLALYLLIHQSIFNRGGYLIDWHIFRSPKLMQIWASPGPGSAWVAVRFLLRRGLPASSRSYILSTGVVPRLARDPSRGTHGRCQLGQVPCPYNAIALGVFQLVIKLLYAMPFSSFYLEVAFQYLFLQVQHIFYIRPLHAKPFLALSKGLHGGLYQKNDPSIPF